MRKTRTRKFSVGIYRTIKKKKKRNRYLYQDFPFCQTNSTITEIVLCAWAPQPNSLFYIVKSAGAYIFLPIKNPDAVWIYARVVLRYHQRGIAYRCCSRFQVQIIKAIMNLIGGPSKPYQEVALEDTSLGKRLFGRHGKFSGNPYRLVERAY
jgi:hypothetical protein